MMHWIALQWIDSSFPTGSYAHSVGLEAWAQFRPRGQSLEEALESMLRNQVRALVPFVREAATRPADWATLDAALDLRLWGQVAARASRAQGRALAMATLRSFAEAADPTAQLMAERARAVTPAVVHVPVMFGMLGGALGTPDEVAGWYLFAVMRALFSAAVRLNVLGPFDAQRRLASMAALAERLLRDDAGRGFERAASASPVLDLLQELHERLPTRLFTT